MDYGESERGAAGGVGISPTGPRRRFQARAQERLWDALKLSLAKRADRDPSPMPVLLVILTVYANHSAQTTAVPVATMAACKQMAAEIRSEFAAAFAGDDPVYVVAKCIQGRRERAR